MNKINEIIDLINGSFESLPASEQAETVAYNIGTQWPVEHPHQNRTAEEILNERIKAHRNEYVKSLPFIYKEAIIEAMQEYANQGMPGECKRQR